MKQFAKIDRYLWIVLPFLMAFVFFHLYRSEPLFGALVNPVVTIEPMLSRIENFSFIRGFYDGLLFLLSKVVGEKVSWWSLSITYVSSYFVGTKALERLGKLYTIKIPVSLIGVIFVSNSFFVNRLNNYHLTYVLCFALLHWVIYYQLKFLREKVLGYPALLISFLIGVMALHFIPIIFLTWMFVFLIYPKGLLTALFELVKSLPYWKLGLVGLIILNTYLRLSDTSDRVLGFTDLDLILWQPVADANLPVLFNVFLLQGEWGSKVMKINAPQLLGAIWVILPILVWTLGFKNHKFNFIDKKFFTTVLIVFVILVSAINTSWHGLSYPFQALYDVGFLRGLRESQKMQSVIGIFFNICAIFAMAYVFDMKNKALKVMTLIVIVALMIINTLPSLYYDQNSISAGCSYPEEFYEIYEMNLNNVGILGVGFHGEYEFCEESILLNPLVSMFGGEFEIYREVEEDYEYLINIKRLDGYLSDEKAVLEGYEKMNEGELIELYKIKN